MTTSRLKSRTKVTPLPRAKRGYAGLSSGEQDLARRRRLLDTALELFTRQGYARTPIEQLCVESRVTSRYFYELFESREALLRALFEEIIDDARAAVIAAIAQPGLTAEARISQAVTAFIRSYVQDARRARLCVVEAVGISEGLEKRRREVIHEFASVIRGYADALAKASVIPKRNYHLFSVSMVGSINELLVEWLTAARPPSIEAVTQEIQLQFRVMVLGGQALLNGSSREAAR
ncbi:MAG TPA: TetR/AcrR family transcriptional regulator [Nevskiaceae bacterium]|nr:TetR/AcrR family transcriptional regulator [Nevskiaceae bacterium]